MENQNIKQWDEARHQELNAHFRELFNRQLEAYPHLHQQVAQGKRLQLEELVESMSLNDQQLWQEYLHLDQLKMHQDMQNYLEGKGSSTDFQNKFYRNHQPDNESNQLW